MNPTCETCRWWREEEPNSSGQRLGSCRKSEPARGWYTTYAVDWCGEHQPKPQPVNQYSSEVER